MRFVALSFALSVGDNVDADDADDDDDDDVVVVAVVVFVVSDDDDDDGLEFPVAAAVKCCCYRINVKQELHMLLQDDVIGFSVFEKTKNKNFNSIIMNHNTIRLPDELDNDTEAVGFDSSYNEIRINEKCDFKSKTSI